MRKILILTLMVFVSLHLLSAQIIIEQQPNKIYNLGDSVSIPILIKALTNIKGSLEMTLICGGIEKNFYKNGISLKYGEEIKLSPAPKLVLEKEVIGDLKGLCKIKVNLANENPVLTNEFRISTLINIDSNVQKTKLNPGENLIIEGHALKESGSAVEGFAKLEFGEGNNSQTSQLAPITKGYFKINKTLAQNLKAGNYNAKITAYEQDSSGVITNQGIATQEFIINQIPKNLEIIAPKQAKPGEEIEIKSILHDQTGVNIPSQVIIKIIDSEQKKLEEKKINTDKTFKFKIKKNQKPENFSIIAKNSKFTQHQNLTILEYPKIKIDLANNSVFITNTGNVKYCNKSLLIKIGNQSVNLDLCIDVGKTQKFKLTAPNGKYLVQIINEGEKQASKEMLLTGNVIGVKEMKKNLLSLMKFPVVWIFIILILGYMGFILFKKGYKRSFFGYIRKKSRVKKQEPIKKEEGILDLTNKKAEISLSITGEKQKATLLCLKIKNLKDLKKNKLAVQETMKKISDLASEYKTFIYENQDNFFFIFSALRTKTFKNEKNALELARKLKEILENHNKLFKQRIDFGISINNGEIISKLENHVLKFMSIKNSFAFLKKISIYSRNKIILGEEIAEALTSEIKTQKHKHNGITFFTITQYKNSEENEKFIRNFLKSIEKK